MDDFMIHYRGFTPADSMKQFFQSLVRRIQDESPNSAFIRASVHLEKGSFRGVIKVNSEAGRFLTFAETGDLRELGTELYEKLRAQLNTWKSTRFLETQSEGGGYEH